MLQFCASPDFARLLRWWKSGTRVNPIEADFSSKNFFFFYPEGQHVLKYDVTKWRPHFDKMQTPWPQENIWNILNLSKTLYIYPRLISDHIIHFLIFLFFSAYIPIYLYNRRCVSNSAYVALYISVETTLTYEYM